jgi:transcription initiation factor TFIIE subunit alpha
MMAAIDDVLCDEAIYAYLLRLIGEEGIDLIRKFPREREWSDEDLAAETAINLNSVRHTLYTLYEKRLAEYRRIKNNETGWLTYLWQLRFDRINDAMRDEMVYILEKLKAREKFEEENDFYICKTCGIIFTFTQAVDRNFSCPECDEPIGHFDNEVLLNALKRRIENLEETLGHG